MGVVLRGALALVMLLTAVYRPAAAAGRYSASRTTQGVRISLQFDRTSYPKNALVAVTATIRNLAHPHLAVPRSVPPYGPCSWPAVTIEAAASTAPNAPPAPRCPAPGPIDLPVGHTLVEHQMIVLWLPAIRSSVNFSTHTGNRYGTGFTMAGPSAAFQLHGPYRPSVRIRKENGVSTAIVSPPSGNHGPIYYRSWGTCSGQGPVTLATYWKRLAGTVISAGCSAVKWHLDVAVLSGSVATVEIGRPVLPPMPRISDEIRPPLPGYAGQCLRLWQALNA